MSIQIQAARAASGPSLPGYGSVRAVPRGMPRGDPGFFGDLWGGLKGAVGGLVTGGPLGAIGGAIGGFTGAGQTSPTTLPTLPPMRTLPLTIQQAQNGQRPPTIGERAARILPGGRTGYEAQTEETMRAGKRSREGWHWNKSGYHLKSGEYVYPGTREVRNRRMNPLNPGAIKLSMRRLGRAKTAATDIGRVTIRKKKCGCK